MKSAGIPPHTYTHAHTATMALSTDVDTDECYEAALEIAQRAGKVYDVD